jgi:hypothetical protein
MTQGLIGLMVTKKEQVLSNSCEYKCLNLGEMFGETHIVANARNWSFIVEKAPKKQLWCHHECIPIV